MNCFWVPGRAFRLFFAGRIAPALLLLVLMGLNAVAAQAQTAPPNQPPIAVDDRITEPFSASSVSGSRSFSFPLSALLANDSDPDNDTLSINPQQLFQPVPVNGHQSNGFISIQGSQATYSQSTPTKQLAAFRYTVSDSRGATATAIVTVGEDASLVVDTASDVNLNEGKNTLREAIEFANSNSGPDTITFNIPTTDAGFGTNSPGGEANVWTIRVGDGYFSAPTPGSPSTFNNLILTNNETTIDGASQTTNRGDTNTAGPEIVVRASNSNCALSIQASQCVIKNLVLQGPPGFSNSQNPTVSPEYAAIVIGGGTSSGFSSAGTNRVEGCYIGTNATGTAPAAPRGAYGVSIVRSFSNVIGGATSDQRNVLSGNTVAGVLLGESTSGNRILNNFIGLNATGTAALSGSGARQTTGILALSSASFNSIGAANAGNVISGNSDGVNIGGSGGGSTGTSPTGGFTVRGNLIGLNAAGTAAIGNSNVGLSVTRFSSSSTNNGVGTIIGGSNAGEGNVISGNGTSSTGSAIGGGGIYVFGESGTFIAGNKIGTDAAGTGAIGNKGNGIAISSSTSNSASSNSNAYGSLIGELPNNFSFGSTSSSGAPNIIAFNTGNGVSIYNSSPSFNSASNRSFLIRRNSVTSNGGAGILIQGGSGIEISSNSISANTGLGIDLGYNGNVNDPNDEDYGYNNAQNFPVLTAARLSSGALTLSGTFNSTPGKNYALEFFANPADDKLEGKTYLGRTSVTTQSDGNIAFSAMFSGTAVTAGQFITATAIRVSDGEFGGTSTGSAGDTSEFSAPLEVVGSVATISVTLSNPSPKTLDRLIAFPTASDGSTPTYSYVWKKNGGVISGQTNGFLDLALPGNGDKGDIVTVEVTANGGAPATASATVINSAPTGGTLTATALGRQIISRADVFDADGDPLTFALVPNSATKGSVDGFDASDALFLFTPSSSPFDLSNPLDLDSYAGFAVAVSDGTENTAVAIKVLLVPPASPKDRNYVSLGSNDNNALGASDFAHGYTALLNGKINSYENGYPTYTLSNRGFNGQTIADLPRKVGGKSVLDLVAADNPAVITAWIGPTETLKFAVLNSAATEAQADDFAGQFRNGYGQLIGALKFTGAKIVVANVPPLGRLPFTTGLGFTEAMKTNLDTLSGKVSNAINFVGTATNTPVVNLFGADASNPVYASNIASDGLHPNDAGYAALADAFFSLLQPLLPTPAPLQGAIISEYRLSGPNGDRDEFIEIYNQGAAPLDLTGWSVGTASIKTTIPSGKVIPPYARLLVTGKDYSLSNYGGTGAAAGDISSAFSSDLPVGSALELRNALGTLVDGTSSSGLPAPLAPTDDYSYARRMDTLNGAPQDTNSDANDFNLVDVQSTVGPNNTIGVSSGLLRLGAPGPENLSSPIAANQLIRFTQTGFTRTGSGNSGTLIVRGTVQNASGRTLSALRFRTVGVTAGTTTGGTPADVRLTSSTSSDGINLPLILQNPPAQPNGGGLNASVSLGGLPGGGLAPNATANVEFVFTIFKSGTFRYLLNAEPVTTAAP